MTTKYPLAIDSNTELPVSIDNVTQVKSEVPNLLRGAIIAIESQLGQVPAGIFSTVRARLDALDGMLQALLANSNIQGNFAMEVRHDGAQVIAAANILDIVGGQVNVPGPGIAQIVITAGGGDPEQEHITVLSNGQTSFTLSNEPIDSTTVMMFINGFKQIYGIDYTGSGQVITWLNTDYTLETTDKVEFWYLIEGGGGGGGGGTEDLATVLSFGNSTGGIDISFSGGSVITSTGSTVITDKAFESKALLIDTASSIPLSPVANKGLVWLRTSDNKLIFTDSSSNNFILNADLAEVLTVGNFTGGTDLLISHTDKLLGRNTANISNVNLAYVDSSDIVNLGDDAFNTIIRSFTTLDFRLGNTPKFTVNATTIDFHSSRGINAADPINPTDVANKEYVDSLLMSGGLGLALVLGHSNTTGGNDIVLSTGDALTGTGGVVNIHATAGTILSGPLTTAGTINAGSHFVSNVLNPVLQQDAATKNYVDTAIAAVPVNDGYEVRVFGTATTTNNTPTHLASYTMNTANKVCMIEVNVIARDQTDNDFAGWKIIGVFERTGGTVTETGESSIIFEEREDLTWTVDFSIVGTTIFITGTGDVAHNVKWRVVGNAIEDG
jgi:hypothetical protein